MIVVGVLSGLLFAAATVPVAAGWETFGDGVSVEPGAMDSRRPIWRCVSASELSCSGICRTYHYAVPSTVPVVYRGSSRSDGVDRGEYCLYLDIFHSDGTAAYGVKTFWSHDTPDWTERVGAYVPKKPVCMIKMHAFLRRGSGTVWFRDLSLERREGRGDVIRAIHRTRQPYSPVDTIAETVFIGTNFITRSFALPSMERLRTPLGRDEVTVWTADSMRRVTPLTFPETFDIPAKPLKFDLCRGECESAQICVSAGDNAQAGLLSVEVGTMKDSCNRLLACDISWQRIGYVPRMPGARRRQQGGAPERETWLPDPLLPARPFRVRKGSTQGVWLTVKALRGASQCGVYRGAVRVVADGATLASIPVAIRVRDFSLPECFALPTAFSIMDCYTRAYYPGDACSRIRQGHDIMLDHRLNPDDISRTEFPAIADLIHARSRGMNRFNIVNLVPPPRGGVSKWTPAASEKDLRAPEFYEGLRGRLKPYVKRLKEAGLAEMAYIYGFDERGTSFFGDIAVLREKLARDFPELPLLTTAFSYWEMSKRPFDAIPEDWFAPDWFCPQTSVYNLELNDKLRRKGKQVWWYTCCSPGYPYANMAFLESPWLEGRMLVGWQTYLLRADGFLYWNVNWWNDQPLLDENDTYFPEWCTRGYWGADGDGVFLYPGKNGILPSIRLAQIRDGVEDYEWLKAIAEPLLSRPMVEKLVRRIVVDAKNFSRDSEQLRAVRSEVGDMAECAAAEKAAKPHRNFR